MNSETVIYSPCSAWLGSTLVSIHGMTLDQPSMALCFSAAGGPCGLEVRFHGSTGEMRAFAAELIRHAEITDAAQALRGAGKAA